MKQIQIGLLGCGTVGTGVVKLLHNHSTEITARVGAPIAVKNVVVRTLDKARDPLIPVERLSNDPRTILDDPEIPIVIEAMGGLEPARTLVLQALAAGKHVVTANKALLAHHWPEILAAANAAGRDVLFEAAVGGSIPIIRTLREGFAGERVRGLRAIINGTSNFILSAMSDEGRSYGDVLTDAQALGYAEADPAMDVGGGDAAQKLSLLVGLAFGAQLDYRDFLVEGIDRVTPLDLHYADVFGFRIKPLAVAERHDDGIEARVHPALIPKDALLASVHGVYNAVVTDTEGAGPSLLVGKGAGMLPTASAVLADTIELCRAVLRGETQRVPMMAFHPKMMPAPPLRPSDAITCRRYLRVTVRDEPGVLATLAGILGHQRISIERMVQEQRDPEAAARGIVEIVMLTHEAAEGDMGRALRAIEHLPFVEGPLHALRVQESG